MSKLAAVERLYTFAKIDSNSSALNGSFSLPRPVGTRKKTIQSVILSLSIKVTISSISAMFLRLKGEEIPRLCRQSRGIFTYSPTEPVNLLSL
jgi:hypothetical protein